jgi:hypothetical protein
MTSCQERGFVFEAFAVDQIPAALQAIGPDVRDVCRGIEPQQAVGGWRPSSAR